MNERGKYFLDKVKETESWWGPRKNSPKAHMVRLPDGQYDWEHWDDLKDTTDCRHCGGTGSAPGDGKTECGFCYNRNHARLKMARGLIVSAIRDAGGDLDMIDRLSEITTIIDSITGDHG